MIEFWAVIGAVCADGTTHQKLFDVTDATKSFQDLQDLRAALVYYGLRLGRWEVMGINRILSQEWDPDAQRKVYFRGYDKDKTLADLRKVWYGAGKLTETPYLELCAIFGLACIDTQFRKSVRAACDPGGDITDLNALLKKGSPDSPAFKVDDKEVKQINKMMQARGDVVALMDHFEITRWVQPAVHPVFGGCDAGYTPKKYSYVSQQDLALYLVANPDLQAQLSSVRVIQ